MSKKNLSIIRYDILKSCHETREGHVGSAFSILELLYIIFKKHIKKNYFILSKGHASIGAYATMYRLKIIGKKIYDSFCRFDSKLGGHPDSTKMPIFNFSTGSLGHGLPNSTGLAFALNQMKINKKIICLMGDQELMEGTTWESLHIIENYNIKNLVLIIDRNNSDFRSIKFLKLKKKLSVFSDKIHEINGHDLRMIDKILNKCLKDNSFNIIIANTIKGYGVKSIANNPAWHHKSPTEEELKKFKKELSI